MDPGPSPSQSGHHHHLQHQQHHQVLHHAAGLHSFDLAFPPDYSYPDGRLKAIQGLQGVMNPESFSHSVPQGPVHEKRKAPDSAIVENNPPKVSRSAPPPSVVPEALPSAPAIPTANSTHSTAEAVHAADIPAHTAAIPAHTAAIPAHTAAIPAHTTSIPGHTRSADPAHSTPAHTSAFTTHPSAVAGHPSTVVAHPSTVSSHPSTVAAHPGSVATHPGSVAGHPSTLAAHQSTIPTHPSAVTANQSTIPTLPSTVATHPSAVAAHSSAVAAHPSTVVTHPSTVATHPSTVAAHQSTIPAHQSTIPAHQSTIPAHPSAAPSVRVHLPGDAIAVASSLVEMRPRREKSGSSEIWEQQKSRLLCTWDDRIAALRRFYEKHNHAKVPVEWTGEERGEKYLGRWVARMKVVVSKRTIAAEKLEQLRNAGVEWDIPGKSSGSAGKTKVPSPTATPLAVQQNQRDPLAAFLGQVEIYKPKLPHSLGVELDVLTNDLKLSRISLADFKFALRSLLNRGRAQLMSGSSQHHAAPS